MGFFADLLKTGANTFTGGLASGLAGAASSIFSGIGSKKRLENQINAQKQLNEQAAALNYEYGEKAAKNAFARQLQMYERSYRDQTYQAMRKQMEDAGLSVGLMYGGSASGGAGGATSGAPLGATGGAEAGRAASETERRAMELQQAQLGLSLANQRADIKLKEAQVKEVEAKAEEARASAARQTEEKITTIQSRDHLVEKLRNEGWNSWIDAVIKEWQASGEQNTGNMIKNGRTGHVLYISPDSYLNQREAKNLAKTISETEKNNELGKAAEALAKLNSERANGYWQELINATIAANAQATEAAARKLATEWETGEYTNWKTWVQIGEDVIGGIAKSYLGRANITKTTNVN